MSYLASDIGQLNHLGEFELAEQRSIVASNQEPLNPAHTLNLAIAVLKQLQYDRAIEHALKTLSLNSLSEQVLATRLLCVAFSNLGSPEMALPYVRLLNHLSESPHISDRCWIGQFYLCLGDPETALHQFITASRNEPHPYATRCIGEAQLSLGDSEGYKNFLEFSKKSFWRIYYSHYGSLLDKMWEGESLAGKSLVVVPHGGFGDYFQHMRYLREIRSHNPKEIIAVAQPCMHDILTNSGFDQAVNPEEAKQILSHADTWCGTFGLEQMRLQGAPRASPTPYLIAKPTPSAKKVCEIMRSSANGLPCIGIYWHSDADAGESKSIPLHNLLPLFSLPIHWVVLQRGFGLRRLNITGLDKSMTITEPFLSTFSDTGYLITQLDAVVTICAWPVHLAGGLGVRTWLLASHALNSRHENRRHESVLYPETVTLIRQPSPGNWREVISTLRNRIIEWLPNATVSS